MLWPSHYRALHPIPSHLASSIFCFVFCAPCVEYDTRYDARCTIDDAWWMMHRRLVAWRRFGFGFRSFALLHVPLRIRVRIRILRSPNILLPPSLPSLPFLILATCVLHFRTPRTRSPAHRRPVPLNVTVIVDVDVWVLAFRLPSPSSRCAIVSHCVVFVSTSTSLSFGFRLVLSSFGILFSFRLVYTRRFFIPSFLRFNPHHSTSSSLRR